MTMAIAAVAGVAAVAPRPAVAQTADEYRHPIGLFADMAATGRTVTRSAMTDVVRGSRDRLDQLARLPGSRREVRAIARHFAHADGRTPAAEALRRAQLWLRAYEVDGRRVYEEERFWGAFVLVGG
jgi:hypothetical protein